MPSWSMALFKNTKREKTKTWLEERVENSPFIALDGIVGPVLLLVAPSKGTPDSGVVGTQGGGPLIIIEGVERHLQQLVSLAKSVPRPVIARIRVCGNAT